MGISSEMGNVKRNDTRGMGSFRESKLVLEDVVENEAYLEQRKNQLEEIKKYQLYSY